jgi:hypothetical protein
VLQARCSNISNKDYAAFIHCVVHIQPHGNEAVSKLGQHFWLEAMVRDSTRSQEMPRKQITTI